MYNFDKSIFISTHAPRTGSDFSSHAPLPYRADFNPRSPHGERHYAMTNSQFAGLFQPTLPARGATCRMNFSIWQGYIFQPTLPARGATRDML